MDLEAFDTFEAAVAVAAAVAAVDGAGHPAVTSQAAAAAAAVVDPAFHQAAEYGCFEAYAVHHSLEIQLTKGQQFLL